MATNKNVKLKAGEFLIKMGDIDNNLYWLQSGNMQVVIPNKDGTNKIIGQISPGELVGEMSFMDGKPRSASVITLSPCQLTKIPVENASISALSVILGVQTSDAEV